MRSVRLLLQFALFWVLLLPSLDEIQYSFTDKWFITDWNDYLAPIIPRLTGLDRDVIMLIVGLIQILVVIMLVTRPRIGGLAAFAGFWLIIANLLLHSAYDIVIRDFGLSMAALALVGAASSRSGKSGHAMESVGS